MSEKRGSEKPSRKARKNGLSPYSENWRGFIDIKLTQEMKDQFSRVVDADYPDFVAWLEKMLDEEYKISFSYDKLHECVIVTLTCRQENHANYGWSLSSRGPTLRGALLVTYYKHVEICNDGAWGDVGETFLTQHTLWS